jgi:hypothetical protein
LQTASIVAAGWILSKGCFSSYSGTPKVVQKRPEIGLDDVEFTPRYRDLLRKIVDNDRAGASDRFTTMPRQLGIPTTLSVGAAGQALSLSLPGWAGCSNRWRERSSTGSARTERVPVKGH